MPVRDLVLQAVKCPLMVADLVLQNGGYLCYAEIILKIFTSFYYEG
jgi:hypothetical protein